MLNKKQVIARLRAFAKHGETPRRADLMEQAANLLETWKNTEDLAKDYAEGFRDGVLAQNDLTRTFLDQRGRL